MNDNRPQPRCANCRSWQVWRQVMLTDDEPKMLGHCVIETEVDSHHVLQTIQGLTAEDFHCFAYAVPDKAGDREHDD